MAQTETEIVQGIGSDYGTKYGADGQHLHRYEKLLWKREAALESWSLKIERHLSEVRNVWAFVGNHFEGFAPETCQRLAQRLGFDWRAHEPRSHRQLPSCETISGESDTPGNPADWITPLNEVPPSLDGGAAVGFERETEFV